MTRATAAHIEQAKRLLAHESAAGDATSVSTPAGRVHDKLHAHLAPLLGKTGIELLFVRSAKLARADFASVAALSLLEGSSALRQSLEARDPAVSTDAAAALFGSLLALLTTFIGERLTHQALRSAWPALDEAAPTETRT